MSFDMPQQSDATSTTPSVLLGEGRPVKCGRLVPGELAVMELWCGIPIDNSASRTRRYRRIFIKALRGILRGGPYCVFLRLNRSVSAARTFVLAGTQAAGTLATPLNERF